MKVVPLLRLPEPADLSPSATASLRELETAWDRLAGRRSEDVLGVFDPLEGRSTHEIRRFDAFEHRLSASVMARARPQPIRLRSRLEMTVAARMQPAFLAGRRDGFSDLARDLAATAALFDPQCRPRLGAVGNAPDRQGDVVAYPHVDLVPQALAQLAAMLDAHAGARPAYAAMLTLAAVCNIHPMTDGNGRVARVWFNLVMSAARSPAYLPIHELSLLSRGGYLVSLRLAHYRGAWDDLAGLLARFARWAAEFDAAAD